MDKTAVSGKNYEYFVSTYMTDEANPSFSVRYVSNSREICYLSRVDEPSYKAKTSSVKLSWKKVKGADGYQIRYARKKSFADAKKVSTKLKSKTVKGLTKGKKYFFSVRAFKTQDGKKKWGLWSKTISVKLK